MTTQPTAKELKELKKKQKQAQRQARKAAAPSPNGPGKANNSNTPATPQGSGNSAAKIVNSTGLFSGIEQPKAIVSKTQVHSAILHLTLQMQSCRIIGSTSRCRAMMIAFQEVVKDFQPPQNSVFSRSFASHLSQQIEVLKSGRGLSVSMGNAIRWLKQETSGLSIDIDDSQAKEYLIDSINVFIRDRIDVADRIIVDTASSHVQDGDVVLTYGRSKVVLSTLIHAYTVQNKKFGVVVADSPPLFEGKKAAKALMEVGIPVTYILLSAIPYVIKGVSTLMVGAHAMVSNGNLYSRAGTSMVAMMASARSIPVLVLCETIKFSDRVQLDSFSVNEFIPKEKAGRLDENLVFFDLTDQKFISKVITEVGALPASSVPVILREYKQFL